MSSRNFAGEERKEEEGSTWSISRFEFPRNSIFHARDRTRRELGETNRVNSKIAKLQKEQGGEVADCGRDVGDKLKMKNANIRTNDDVRRRARSPLELPHYNVNEIHVSFV